MPISSNNKDRAPAAQAPAEERSQVARRSLRKSTALLCEVNRSRPEIQGKRKPRTSTAEHQRPSSRPKTVVKGPRTPSSSLGSAWLKALVSKTVRQSRSTLQNSPESVTPAAKPSKWLVRGPQWMLLILNSTLLRQRNNHRGPRTHEVWIEYIFD